MQHRIQQGWINNGTANDFGSLIYTKAGDSLSGKTVSQILDVANRALAGLGLPAGYDFSSLNGLIDSLNNSFHECNVSSFAATYLSEPSIVVQCASQVPAPDSNLVSASDACSSVTLSVLPDVITEQTCANRYVILRTWVARDACGNTNSCTYRITVNDTSAPTINCPANLVLDCPAITTTNATGVATASDNCGGAVTVTFSDIVSNACGSTRTIFRTWTATDICGNSSSSVQTITVRDITPPILTNPPDKIVTADQSWGFDAPSATDGCSAATVQVFSTTTNVVGGTLVVTCVWQATDECGNRSTTDQVVTILPGPPRLELLQSSEKKLLLCWPAWASDYRVEVSDISVVWKPLALSPIISNKCFVIEFMPSDSKKFYRLSKASPSLELLRKIPGTLMLTWPPLPSGFQLEASDSIIAPNWAPVAGSAVSSNAMNTLNVPATAPRKFYRLHGIAP